MQNNDIPLPGVGKISKLIDALREYAMKEAGTSPGEPVYHAPTLSLWDALLWFELAQDWEVVDFLISGSDRAKLLVTSLQSCLQWYGQTELEEINSRLKIMSMIN